MTKHQSFVFERVAATLSAASIVGLVGYLLIRNMPIEDPVLGFALRLVLSLSTAILGATIPGFLGITWQGKGLVVRAGGALALFLLSFIYTPPQPVRQTTQVEQKSEGPFSPTINNNSGNVKIESTINK